MEIIKKFEPLFGEWYAESFIGAGSFGRVYKIYREEFGEKFYSALKYISIPAESGEVMQLRMDGMDDQSISTYYTELTKGISAETRLMNKLRGNTNIVSFEDSKVIPKPNGMGYDIFIRMELLTGLPTRMVSAPLSTSEVVKLGIDICKALIICKQHGIIHRDIKPDNIFISNTGDFKLGDFGIARQLEKTATFMSKKGTYNYMAPEVYKGEKYGATCDLYSLGIVMYRLLNKGRLPFMPPAPQVITPDDRENAIIRRMKGEEIPAPCDADHKLAGIVLKACAFDPMDRFSSADEMKKALTRCCHSESERVPITSVADYIQSHNDADETQGVFGKNSVSEADSEVDSDATSGVFSSPVKEAADPETEDDSDKTQAAFTWTAPPRSGEPPKPENSRITMKNDSNPFKEHMESKPIKKRFGFIIGIFAALSIALGLMAILGVFGKKHQLDNGAFSLTPALETIPSIVVASELPNGMPIVPDYKPGVIVTYAPAQENTPEQSDPTGTPVPVTPTPTTEPINPSEIVIIPKSVVTRALNVEDFIRVNGTVPVGATISVVSVDPSFSLRSQPVIDENGNFNFEVNLFEASKAYPFTIICTLADGQVYERSFCVERPPVYYEYIPTIWPDNYEEMIDPVHLTDKRGFCLRGTIEEILQDDDYLVAKLDLDAGQTVIIEYHNHYPGATEIVPGSHYVMFGYSMGLDAEEMLHLFIWFVQD